MLINYLMNVFVRALSLTLEDGKRMGMEKIA